MAIRRSMNLEHYRAQQANPVFLRRPRRYIVVTDWRKIADVILWTAAFGIIAGCGFVIASMLLL